MGYPAYEEYITSDRRVKYPKEWSLERLRFSILLNPVKSEVADWENDTLVSFVPMEAVGEHGGIDLSKQKPIGDVYGGYTYFADGDIVIAKITPCFENGKGSISKGLKNGIAFGTTEFHVVRPLKNISKRWIFYLTMSDAFRNIGASEMLGAGGQKRVPEAFIKNFRTGIPSLTEQQKIADFLDWKTAQIDTLIAKKKQLIEKLREKRMALITQAVTKGLDPDAPMRDSGIPWLGEVPGHWNVAQLRRIITLQRGVDITKDEQEEGDVPVVSSGGISSYHNTAFMKGPGVIVGRKGTAGAVHYIDSAYWPHDTTLYVKEFWGSHPKFIYYLLSSMNLTRFDTGSSNPTVNRNIVHPEKVAWPKFNEQRDIANFLDVSTNKIDRVVEKMFGAIDSLTEYRTALITAATTGKIDVRNIRIPKTDTEALS